MNRPSQAAPSSLAERLARAWGRHSLVSFLRHGRRVTFFRQLHALLTAGIPLPTAFAQLVAYAPDARMGRALAGIARDVKGGGTLGDALGRHASELDDANVELIAFAEEAGKLEPVVAAIIGHLEKLQSLRWRATLMLLWPAYLGASVVFVGPLLEVAQTLKPGMSVGALYLSALAGSLGWAVLGLAGLFAAPLAIAAAGLEVWWDRWLLVIPLVSRSVRGLYAARFVMTLGLGTDAGMEVHRSLKAAVKATGSPSLLVALPRAEAALRGGSSLTEAVERLGLLDRSTLGTLAVAETTGTLDESLAQASRQLESSALRAVQILMVVLVGLIAVALLAKVVGAIIGAALEPLRRAADAAGSGNLERL